VFTFFRGIHLAVIHTRPDILTQLLALVATDNRLLPALDEQNRLYQVLMSLQNVCVW
jgi:hypothetical protein